MDLLYKMTGKLIAEGLTSATYSTSAALEITSHCVGAFYFKRLIDSEPESKIIASIKLMEVE